MVVCRIIETNFKHSYYAKKMSGGAEGAQSLPEILKPEYSFVFWLKFSQNQGNYCEIFTDW